MRLSFLDRRGIFESMNEKATIIELKARKKARRKARRASARQVELADLRDGRRNRATTFTDRKKEASRRACRGKVTY